VAIDPEAVLRALRQGWRGEAYRIAPGPFGFSGQCLQTGPGILVDSWRCEGALRARLRRSSGALHLGFLEGKALRIDGGGVRHEALVISPCGASFSATMRGVAGGVGVAIDAAVFPGAEALHERWRARAQGGSVVLPVGTAAATLRDLLRRRCAERDQNVDGNGIDGVFGAGIIQTARAALTAALDQADLRKAEGGKRRHALAAQAEEIIWERVRAPDPGDVSLDALCAALGTTRRTLQLAFQEHFGVNFGLMARAIRLRRVREALRTGDISVSDAAFRHGFEHLGRFAAYYRGFYGENPSTTRRGNAR
jgi:AraC-like DNA-binding protein